MISLLVWLLVVLILVYIAHLIIGALKVPENIKQIAYLIVALIVLLAVLGQLGVIGGGSYSYGTPLLR